MISQTLKQMSTKILYDIVLSKKKGLLKDVLKHSKR
jgi:hypothetical protein